MAWTSPATYSVSEVVTAAKLNTHIRDNLLYLKGTSGAITLDNLVGILGAPTYTLDVLGADAAASGIRVRTAGFGSVPVPGAIADSTVINARGFNMTTDGIVIGAAYRPGLGIGAAASRVTPLIALNNTGGPSLLVENGNSGFGTASPQGKIHAYGAGGGWMFLSAAGVAGSVVTLAAAGTVVGGAIVYVLDRANTGGAVGGNASGVILALGATTAYANGGDTVTIAVTAGGAITAQRTAGAASTHNVNIMAIYY